MQAALKTVLICVLIGLSFGIYYYFSYDQRPIRIAISLISSLSIGSLMMFAIYHRHYLTVITSHQSVKVILMIFLLLLAALLGSEFTFWAQAQLSDTRYIAFTGGSIYILNILVVLVSGIPIYVSEEWKTVLNSKMMAQQYQLLQLEQEKMRFELEMLRAKINPHFLYNVHNTIAGLIAKDPVKAEQLVVLLSKFFRFTLNKGSVTYHPIRDEIEIIDTYLSMQQIRFENRLKYLIQVDEVDLNLLIPSFILQPMVENAIKHGIETTVGEGFISVEIKVSAAEIFITIGDSGPPFSNEPSSGIGIEMVMNKLKLLCQKNFTLTFNNSPKKHVSIIIPKRVENVIG